MSGQPSRDGPEGQREVPGRRAAITGAHAVTIGVSLLVLVVALGSVLLADGPRGSRPLGLALGVVAGVTVGVTWSSLRSFRRHDRPHVLRMAAVGAAWMAVTLVAASVAPPG